MHRSCSFRSRTLELGIVNLKLGPTPTWDSAQIRPPYKAIREHSANLMPVPGYWPLK